MGIAIGSLEPPGCMTGFVGDFGLGSNPNKIYAQGPRKCVGLLHLCGLAIREIGVGWSSRRDLAWHESAVSVRHRCAAIDW